MKNFFNKFSLDLWNIFGNTPHAHMMHLGLDDGNTDPIDPSDPLCYWMDKGMSLAVGAVVTAFCFGVSIVCLCIIYGYFFPVK
jgi:hypothetical protein